MFKPARGIQLNRSHPFARNLVAPFLMNEFTGNKIYAPGGFQGNFNANSYWQDEGVRLNNPTTSTDSKITTDIDYNADLGSQGTIVCCFKTVGVISYAHICGSYPTQDAFRIYRNNSDAQLYFQLNSAAMLVSGVATNIWDGAYHTVAFTWDADANVRKYYIDGVLETTNTTAFTMPTGETMNIGGRHNQYYANDAVYKYFYPFNTVLSDIEIAQITREPFAMFEGGINPALLYAAAVSAGNIFPVFAGDSVHSALFGGQMVR